jgi:integrase
MNKKITVTIESRLNLLRLRWNDGKRRSLSLGWRDTPPNRNAAAVIKRRIEADWNDGNYDESRLRYTPQITGHNATDITAPELFKRFTQHKLKTNTISEHTASVRYLGIRRALERELNMSISGIDRNAAEKLAEHFCKTLTPVVAKAQLGLIKACWDWGKLKYQVAVENPWLGLASRFKAIDKRDMEPFTKKEVTTILNGFRSSQKYSHYTDFVSFQFGLGARTGEGVALKWESIKPDFSSVWIGESVTGKFKNSTTKTGKARRVLLPPSIATMLAARQQAINPQPGDLVFPELGGGSIDYELFGQRWQQVLASSGVAYRRFYNTRHTAISHALERGANPVNVAKACGHDVKTLLDTYAHIIEQKQVFVEF